MILPDDIECYFCGNTEGMINAMSITKDGGVVGYVFACDGECTVKLSGAIIKMDQFIIT
jgi:hypothetical protein